MSDVITIHYTGWMIDFPTFEKKDINLDEVAGFKFHRRVHGWRVEVVLNEMQPNVNRFKSYELNGTVDISEIKKILSDDRCVVLAFTNGMSYASFQNDLIKLLTTQPLHRG